jgi:hypothetical protein
LIAAGRASRVWPRRRISRRNQRVVGSAGRSPPEAHRTGKGCSFGRRAADSEGGDVSPWERLGGARGQTRPSSCRSQRMRMNRSARTTRPRAPATRSTRHGARRREAVWPGCCRRTVCEPWGLIISRRSVRMFGRRRDRGRHRKPEPAAHPAPARNPAQQGGEWHREQTPE